MGVLAPFYLQVELKFPPRGSFHTGKPATTANESSDLCAHTRERVPKHSGPVRRSGSHTPGGVLRFYLLNADAESVFIFCELQVLK